MALQIAYTDENTTITVPTAYAKIDRFNGDKTTLTFNVATYASQQARTDNKAYIGYKVFDIPTPTSDPIVAAYTHLKTLPEYAEATDV